MLFINFNTSSLFSNDYYISSWQCLVLVFMQFLPLCVHCKVDKNPRVMDIFRRPDVSIPKEHLMAVSLHRTWTTVEKWQPAPHSPLICSPPFTPGFPFSKRKGGSYYCSWNLNIIMLEKVLTIFRQHNSFEFLCVHTSTLQALITLPTQLGLGNHTDLDTETIFWTDDTLKEDQSSVFLFVLFLLQEFFLFKVLPRQSSAFEAVSFP